ncbi:MAG: PPK2 family polyphosphate kinase [bacterium]|nr:PPK2 family polyphosphate kinase [bacterium]
MSKPPKASRKNNPITAEIDDLRVNEGDKFRLKDWPTEYEGDVITEDEAKQAYKDQRDELEDLHDRLYAHKRYGLMVVVQGLDASGKDGAIKFIEAGMNPHGVQTTSFKRPSEEELAHDFLWRHYKATPGRGEIVLHNRSHYEYALGPRVFPEFVLLEHIPDIKTVADVDARFWKERLAIIRDFEENLVSSGTIILKFFMNVSKEAQRKRLYDRLQEPEKNWKFKVEDLKVREHWSEYRKAYEHAIESTSIDEAPWYILPADTKWYARYAMMEIVLASLRGRHPTYPRLSKAKLEEFKKGLDMLEGEK